MTRIMPVVNAICGSLLIFTGAVCRYACAITSLAIQTAGASAPVAVPAIILSLCVVTTGLYWIGNRNETSALEVFASFGAHFKNTHINGIRDSFTLFKETLEKNVKQSEVTAQPVVLNTSQLMRT